MITSYEIKEILQEKVVVLHLDFSLEIGSFNSRQKEDLLSTVKKYIKKLDLKENYQKILLMSGSIIVATLVVINNDIKWLSALSSNTQNSNSSLILNTEIPSASYFEKETLVIPETQGLKQEIIKDTSIVESEVEQKNINVVEDIGEEVVSSSKTNTLEEESNGVNINQVKQDISVKEENVSTNVEEVITEEKNIDLPVQSEEQEIQKQMVTVYRNNGTILEIELEEYIVGVVAAEMPASFSSEALKSQAVVARTYALRKITEGEILTDTVSTQAYIDTNQMKTKWGTEFSKYYNKINKAVSETKGEYITYQGNYINAVYHSTSNGYTEDAVNVWKENYPYLKSVESSWDKSVNSYERTITRDYQNLLEVTGLNKEKVEIKILSRNASGRVETVQIGNKTYTGVEFRNLLGLRSTDFDIEVTDNNIKITTRGYGHGVGMSQYGANEMAKLGYSYQQIIKHYYTGVKIQK